MECPICYEMVQSYDRFETPCNHIFHVDCISRIIKNTCPMCRRNIVSPFASLLDACKNGNLDIINRYKSVELCRRTGWTDETPLMMAVEYDRVDAVRELIPLSDVNFETEGISSLMISCYNGNAEISEMLAPASNIDKELAYIHKGVQRYVTPLMMACYIESVDTVAVMIKYANVGHVTRSGDTALMVASTNGNIPIIRLLMNNSDIYQINDEGETAISQAKNADVLWELSKL